MSKEVILALGGGYMRGIAHVGVIKCLVEHDYSIAGIAGSSIGGLIGCLFAAGVGLDKIDEAIISFVANPHFKRHSADEASLMGTMGLEETVKKIIGDKLLEDFPIPFVATAVDLQSGKEIVIKTGSAMKAIRTAIALPGIFPSQVVDQYNLIDGGVVDPIPVKAARELDPSLPIIAVSLTKKPANYDSSEPVLPFLDSLPTALVEILLKNRLFESLVIFTQSLDVITAKLEDLSLQVDLPDVIVAPEVGHYPMLEKVIPPELESKGYETMLAALPQVEQSLTLVSKVRRVTKYVVASPIR